MNGFPKSALLVTPHQDDAEGGCGGTVASWAQQGAEVVYVLCTNGDKGTSDPAMTSAKLAEIREREQEEAARVLGVKKVVPLRQPDGGLEDTLDLRAWVTREIRRYKPELVMCIDPYRSRAHTHRDHRMSGQVALDAAFTYAWSSLSFPEQITEEGLEPHRVKEALLWGSEDPDVYVDIEKFLDLKSESLGRHASQMSSDPVRRAERTRQNSARQGERAGVDYAECFRRIEFNLESLASQFMYH